MEELKMLALSGLFLAAFIAATLLPGQSEAVLLALVFVGLHPVWLLVTVASAGNVLGSLVNWIIGRFMMRYAGHHRFPFTSEQIARAQGWYGRWGWMSLWASWVPIIGDPLTLAAGIMREPLWRFLLIVTLAKAGRYVALVLIARAAV
jgi:membrane protein YqaA with SNARE-associated domain